MPDQYDSPKSIFLSAVEIQSEQERKAFVADACGEDHELLEEVNRLLDHQEQAE